MLREANYIEKKREVDQYFEKIGHSTMELCSIFLFLLQLPAKRQ
jgi:hypothetical protein